jgi:hypothetical protein
MSDQSVVSAPYGAEFLPPGERRHETSDANTFWLFSFAGALILGAILMYVFLWIFFTGLSWAEPRKELRPPAPADAQSLAPPEPRLQTDFVADYNAIRTDQENRISQYRWENKKEGIVRIPVSRAMDLSAEQGLPRWKLKRPDELTRDAFGNLRAGGKESTLEEGR